MKTNLVSRLLISLFTLLLIGFCSQASAQCAAPATGIIFCSPAASTTVSSPVHVRALASARVNHIDLFVDNVNVASANSSVLDVYVTITPGTHNYLVGSYIKNHVWNGQASLTATTGAPLAVSASSLPAATAGSAYNAQ